MASKYALVIGNSHYDDPRFPQLKTPPEDAKALASLLEDKDIGSFDRVILLIDATQHEMRIAIGDLFEGPHKPDDMLLFYFSGHGELDNSDNLYLVARDTEHGRRLRSTGLPASYVADYMHEARSRRQVILLDACYSGAFGRGTKGRRLGTKSIFQGNGYGRYVLTSSDAVQLSWEGDRLMDGDISHSFFTHFLLDGLRTGTADRNGDGYIDLDELYDHIEEGMAHASSKQEPLKFTYNEKGKLLVAYNPVQPIPLETEQLTFKDASRRAIAPRPHPTILDQYSESLYRSDRLSLEPELSAEVIRRIIGEPFEWCEIPTGSTQIHYTDDYIMGALVDRRRFHATKFYMAKFPITNAQFNRFIRAGYYDEFWWPDPVIREAQKGPHEFWDEREFEDNDLPRVHIYIDEAIAFCNWLDAQARIRSAEILTGYRIYLPTEIQWQRAAQGDDERQYPWGNSFEPTHCNCGKDTNDLPYSSVTKYCSGASPFGVIDMCGNAFEYTVTLVNSKGMPSKDAAAPIIRGGSSTSYRDAISTSLRVWNGWGAFNGKVTGFRIALINLESGLR